MKRRTFLSFLGLAPAAPLAGMIPVQVPAPIPKAVEMAGLDMGRDPEDLGNLCYSVSCGIYETASVSDWERWDAERDRQMRVPEQISNAARRIGDELRRMK